MAPNGPFFPCRKVGYRIHSTPSPLDSLPSPHTPRGYTGLQGKGVSGFPTLNLRSRVHSDALKAGPLRPSRAMDLRA